MPYIVNLTLGFIGLSVGAELEYKYLKGQLRNRTILVMFEALGAFIIVGLLAWWWTGELYFGLVYGTIATATCPATTASVFKELRAKGPLKDTVIYMLLIDDIIAIILASFALPFAISAIGGGTSILDSVIVAIREIGLSIILGIAIGYVFTMIYRREKHTIEHIEMIFMTVFFGVGISEQLHASPILTLMVVGIFTVNKCERSKPVFHEAEKLEKPFVLAFFTLIGLSFDFTTMAQAGVIVLIYVVGRSAGKILGSYSGGTVLKMPAKTNQNLGMSLLSQAGVAIGLATYLYNRLKEISLEAEEIGVTILATVTITTILFQIIGPLGARFAIIRAGEASRIHLDDEVLAKPQLMPLLTPYDPHD